MSKRNNGIKKLRRVVIKIGSSVLADPEGGLQAKVFRGLARSFVKLSQDQKLQLLLVSSGAVALGAAARAICSKYFSGYRQSMPFAPRTR